MLITFIVCGNYCEDLLIVSVGQDVELCHVIRSNEFVPGTPRQFVEFFDRSLIFKSKLYRILQEPCPIVRKVRLVKNDIIYLNRILRLYQY